MFSAWYNDGTNCVITSAPQQGKSKLATLFGREHILDQNPVAFLDPHSKSYHDLVSYCAWVRPVQPVVCIDLAHPHLINGLDIFRFKGGNLYAHVSRLTRLIVQAWGIEDADLLPRYESVMGIVLAYMSVAKVPLFHAAKLLEYGQKVLRAHAISVLPEEYREDVRQLQLLPFPRFMERVESTRNKLRRFVADESVRFFTSVPGWSVKEIWDKNAALLVNAVPSDYLSDESSRVCLALIAGEFFHEARRRMSKPKPCYLYADEFQTWATPDLARMLNETPKSGLRITVIHHHSAEFHKHPYLVEAVRTGCGIKIVMAGVPPQAAHEYAEEFFPEELNDDWEKEPKVHYVTEHEEEEYEEVTESEVMVEGESGAAMEGMVGDVETASVTEGGSAAFHESYSVRRGTRFRPILERIEDGWEYYSLEEKRSMLAERFLTLQKQEAYLKRPDRVFFWELPLVEDPRLPRENVLRYLKGSQTRAYLPINARHFLEEATPAERRDRDRRNAQKRPVRLAPQE